MADGKTLSLTNNIVSKKKLVGIANFLKHNSESTFLSEGSEILSTEKEIRDTKKASVLVPFLSGVVDVNELLTQAKAGGIKLVNPEVAEFIVDLANEKATTPQIHRPRVEEVLSADGLFDRYKSGFEISAQVFKDTAFYNSVLSNVKNGVATLNSKTLKGEIVEATEIDSSSTDAIKESAILFTNQLRQARADLKAYKDRVIQGKFKNEDIKIVISAEREILIENDARYNIYNSPEAQKASIADGNLDGSPFIVSKHLPANVDFILLVKGSASSIFSILEHMNYDKVVGLNAYAASLEFNEGTGSWFPHLITIGSNDKTKLVPQSRSGYGPLTLNPSVSKTVAGNKT